MELYFKIMLFITAGGVLFSGYLAGKRFFTQACAFNEPCPEFIGYSACYFGFGMFVLLFIASLFGFFYSNSAFVWLNALISFVGVIFAGYFTVPEVKLFLSGQTNYSLGLPTCSYGLVFFAIIFTTSLAYLVKSGIFKL